VVITDQDVVDFVTDELVSTQASKQAQVGLEGSKDSGLLTSDV
jgi:hypothetical protein